MNPKLFNTEIESLTPEHGAKIIIFYQDHGFNTGPYTGKICRAMNAMHRFYGTNESGIISNRSQNKERRTITLEEAQELVKEKKLFTIQDLREGKCAVIHPTPGNRNSDLTRVLRSAFPLDTCKPTSADFYYKDISTHLYSTHLYWDGSDTTDLPKQSLADFLTQLDIQESVIKEKKLFTIQDLIDGKCAILNPSIGHQKNDDLHRLLIMAFPLDHATAGLYRYYFKGNYKEKTWSSSDSTDLPSQSLADFITQLDMNDTNTDSRFPFQLKYDDAQRIINLACTQWQKKLASTWGTGIVLGKSNEISEDFYREMRKVCTVDQNILFDKIFGTDIKDKSVDLSNYNLNSPDPILTVRTTREYKERGFYLSKKYDWEIKIDSIQQMVLIPTLKD